MPSSAVPVSAPGKLFLLGEYAVLGGGPALVTSVERHVHVRPRNDTDGYSVEGTRFDDPLHLPLLIREVLRDQESLDIDLNGLTVDVGELYRDDIKLGLGSSAASTAAIIASTAPQLSRKRRFELALEVHRKLQGGIGSGADIAVGTFGGPLAYHLTDPRAPFDRLTVTGLEDTTDELTTESATFEKLPELPDDLRVDAVWTGHSARTVSFVDAVRNELIDDPERTIPLLDAIATAARRGIGAVRNGDANRFVDAIRDGDRAMEELGAATRVPIITDTHRRIRALAHTTHAVAKPSGAGGGDFTLLVGPADAPVPAPIDDEFFVVSIT